MNVYFILRYNNLIQIQIDVPIPPPPNFYTYHLHKLSPGSRF